MIKYVSEIFGFPPTNKTDKVTKIRRKYKCPFYSGFKDGLCDPVNKKSNLTDDKGYQLLNHQSGACSVMYTHRGSTAITPVIICPYRFFEKNKDDKYIVFDYIKNKFFKNKELILVPEIGLGNYGRADGILCQISKKPNNKIEITDYAHLEIQSDATTGTRGLILCIKDFFDGKDIIKNSYSYGLNSKASIKGSSLQMIDKGYLFKHFHKKSLWILQDSLFQILCTVYNIDMIDISDTTTIDDMNLIFVVISSDYDKLHDKYKLKVSKCYATSPDLLQKAISKKTPIEESKIINSVLSKISNKKYYKL